MFSGILLLNSWGLAGGAQDVNRVGESTQTRREELQGTFSSAVVSQGGAQTALAALEELQKMDGPGADHTKDFLRVAAALRFAQDRTKSGRVLRDLLDHIPANHKLRPALHLEMAHWHRTFGSESKMINCYQQALELAQRAIETTNSESKDVTVLEIDRVKVDAAEALARHFMSDGKAEQAIAYWRAASPSMVGCGNALPGIRCRTDAHIAECLVQLGRSQEALNDYLLPHLLKREQAASADVASLAVSIYEKRGTLKNFLAVIKPIAEKYPRETPGIAYQIGLIRQAAGRRDLDFLLKELEHSGDLSNLPAALRYSDGNWRQIAAAHALAGFGGEEFAELKRRYGLLHNRGEFPLSSGNCQAVWFIYAMALSKSPDANAYLPELLEQTKNWPIHADVKFALELPLSARTWPSLSLNGANEYPLERICTRFQTRLANQSADIHLPEWAIEVSPARLPCHACLVERVSPRLVTRRGLTINPSIIKR